jgi:hypothetical protein
MAAKAGSHMRVLHSIDTHRNRHRDFTGTHDRISKMTSIGRKTEVFLSVGPGEEGAMVLTVAPEAVAWGGHRRRDDGFIPIVSGFFPFAISPQAPC